MAYDVFNFKYQMHKYSPFYAFSIPTFHDALRYFVRQMRCTDFVRAHHALGKRYGWEACEEVERFCEEMVITTRQPCGRLFLAEGYEKRLPCLE